MFRILPCEDIHRVYLAFAPLLLSVSTGLMALKTGLLGVLLLLLLTIFFYPLRFLVPPRQRLIIILLSCVSLALMTRSLANLSDFSLPQEMGSVFPLLFVNSLVLSTIDFGFSGNTFRKILKRALSLSMPILILFLFFGAIRSLSEQFTIFTAPFTFLLMVAFLLAGLNAVNSFITNRETLVP